MFDSRIVHVGTGFGSEPVDAAQDKGEQIAGYRDFG